MNEKRLRKYLKKLAKETDFWFDIELTSDKTNVELTIHGDNPEGEDWQWSFSVKNSNKERKFLEAIRIEIKNAYDNFDIEENVELMLEAKRNGCQGIPNVVDLLLQMNNTKWMHYGNLASNYMNTKLKKNCLKEKKMKTNQTNKNSEEYKFVIQYANSTEEDYEDVSTYEAAEKYFNELKKGKRYRIHRSLSCRWY